MKNNPDSKDNDDHGTNNLEIYTVIDDCYSSGEFNQGYTHPFYDMDNSWMVKLNNNPGDSEDCPPGDESEWTITFDVNDNCDIQDLDKWFWLAAFDHDGNEDNDDQLYINSSANSSGVFAFA